MSFDIDDSEIESLIKKCLEEISEAKLGNYDVDRAERTAALFLEASIKLSMLIEGIEFSAKHSKNEIERIAAEKYMEIKTANADKKITETAVTQLLAGQAEVIDSKRQSARDEATLKKWNNILNILKDSHVYFRGIGRKDKF
jgi:hypothetical protein